MQHARLAAFVVASLLISCAAGGATEGPCTLGSDCESGICQDGSCVMASGGGGSGGHGGANGGGGSNAGGDATGGSNTGGESTASGAGACSPNHDGTITRAEVPIKAGLTAKYETATGVTFATAGTTNGDGTRDWNMAAMLSGDHAVLLETLAMSGQWFDADFPNATYAAKLSDSSDLLGVFEINDTALLLRGVVSPTSGIQKTELTYDPPVVTLQFPMTSGTTWSTTANVTGYAQGIYSIYTERYDSSVDATGTLEAPFGKFKVLRVKTTLTRTVGALVTVIRSFNFASECFGTVASVTSQDDESQAEFTNVAELKRLAP